MIVKYYNCNNCPSVIEESRWQSKCPDCGNTSGTIYYECNKCNSQSSQDNCQNCD